MLDAKGFGRVLFCPYCMRRIPDPAPDTSETGLYEVECACGGLLEILRECKVRFRFHQCSPPRA